LRLAELVPRPCLQAGGFPGSGDRLQHLVLVETVPDPQGLLQVILHLVIIARPLGLAL
jgi:hypothetical protein